jgi:hypothetical protein
MKRLLFFTVFMMTGCTIEDIQDCSKIQRIEVKSSGYYLVLENNIIIYNGHTPPNYSVNDYYCYK